MPVYDTTLFSSEKNVFEYFQSEAALTNSLLSCEKETDFANACSLYFSYLEHNLHSFQEAKIFVLHFLTSLLFWLQKETSAYSIPTFPFDEYYNFPDIDTLKKAAVSYFLQLWAILHSDEQLSAEACVQNLMKQIQDNPSQVGTLETNARKYHISKYVLCRYFKRYTGKNCGEYIKEIRIEKAKKLLRETNHKIYEISQQVGFQDSGYFTQYFRKAVGMTPKQYRFKKK